MGMQRALGRPGRARRVDDDRRVVGRRVAAPEPARRLARGPPRSPACRRCRHRRRRSPPAARAAGRRISATFGQFASSVTIDARAGVAQPVLERVGAEEHEQRHRDQTGPVRGDVGDGGLVALREEDRHAVPGRAGPAPRTRWRACWRAGATPRTSSAGRRPHRPRRSAPWRQVGRSAWRPSVAVPMLNRAGMRHRNSARRPSYVRGGGAATLTTDAWFSR